MRTLQLVHKKNQRSPEEHLLTFAGALVTFLFPQNEILI